MNDLAFYVPSPPKVLTKDNWPPDYVSVFAWRQHQLTKLRRNPELIVGAKVYYKTHPVEFICHWVDTYDPRRASGGGMVRVPFVLFERQAQLVRFFADLSDARANGLVEKCRDMGATWCACAFSAHQFLFNPGSAVGWGSRKEALVDKIGDPDSIFEKIRMLLRGLPIEFMPPGFDHRRDMSHMRITCEATGSSITGEAGDNIGRGGRKLIYFKDESAHYERPELIEAALADNTNTQIDISSVNGLGNVFHRRRESGLDWNPGAKIDPERTNVLVMDWKDHPDKTEEWYESRRVKAESEGMLHIFEQEVNRNYSASVVGTIIPYLWIQTCVDAHIKLGIDPTGKRFGGLDVADNDGTGDTNAFAQRNGILLESIDEWGLPDVGATTRRAIGLATGPIEIQYDSVGVGSGVKSEANRLAEMDLMPKGVKLISWSAGAGVLEPEERVVDSRAYDEQSPLNKDFYANLKAQAWWQLRLRFERTYKAITEGVDYPVDQMISLSSEMPLLHKLMKELAQVTKKQSTGTLKMVIEKAPEGTMSPNLGDATVMAYWPIPDDDYSLEGW